MDVNNYRHMRDNGFRKRIPAPSNNVCIPHKREQRDVAEFVKLTELGLKLHGITSELNVHKYPHQHSYEMSRGHRVSLKQHSLRLHHLQPQQRERGRH